MVFIIACFLFGIVFAITEGSFASLFVLLLILSIGAVECMLTPAKYRKREYRILGVVTFFYSVSAFITSRNFLNGKFFLVSDVTQYTRWLGLTRPEDDYGAMVIENYTGLLDKDSLHEVFVRLSCIFGNYFLGGANEYYLTLLHTFFGVLAILAIYRSLLYFFDDKKSYKYTLLFAFCSPFLFYSTVIIRDILIAFCFARVIEIIVGDYKIKNIVLIVLYAILASGVRLYSGLFLFTFVLIYIVKSVQKEKAKFILIPLFVIIISGVIATGALFSIYEQTITEVQYYQEFDQDRAGSGLASRLLALPPIIKEGSMFFYSQMMPFPFYSFMDGAKTPTEIWEAATCIFYPIWWYLIFYSLFICVIFFKGFKSIKLEYKLLIILCFVYILMNTAQIDVRRMMHVYPFLYIMSQYCKDRVYTKKQAKTVIQTLSVAYIGLLLVYMFIKG